MSKRDDKPKVEVERMSVDELDVMVIDIETPEPDLPGLTAAERAVVELVLAGSSNKEIAEARGASEKTVANQLRSAYQKLGVSSRFELAAKLGG